MALPKLPATNTPRYKLRYTAGGAAHSITVHMGNAGSAADAVTNGTALANLLKTVMWSNCVFGSIEYAAAGSNVFNPVAALNIAGSQAGNVSAVDAPRAASYVGRSNTGRKTRLFIYGYVPGTDVNWRVENAENAPSTAIVNGLNNGTGDVRCIDSSVPLWKAYANVGYNDHWVKQARRGAG